MSTERHTIELDDNISAGLSDIDRSYKKLTNSIKLANAQLTRNNELQRGVGRTRSARITNNDRTARDRTERAEAVNASNQNARRTRAISDNRRLTASQIRYRNLTMSSANSSEIAEQALESRRAFRASSNIERNRRTVSSNNNVGRSYKNISIAGIGAGAAVFMAGRKIYESTIALEALETSLATASGSLMEYDRNARFFGETSRSLGINTLQSADAFKGFIASAKGTAIEGKKARDIFKALTRSGKAMKLSGEQTNGVFLALSQMLSKGTVQSEELRGQLSERLPGAFSIMARALNVTTQELGKMLQKGEVLAADALPKFAKEMEKTFGGGVDGAIDATSAKVTMFSNKIDVLATGIGKKLTPYFNKFVDVASRGLDDLNEKMGFAGFGEGTTKSETALSTFAKDVNLLKSMEKANAPLESRLMLMQKINAEGASFMKSPFVMKDGIVQDSESLKNKTLSSAGFDVQRMRQEFKIADLEADISKYTKQYLTAFRDIGGGKIKPTGSEEEFSRRRSVQITRDNAKSELEASKALLKNAKFMLKNFYGGASKSDTDPDKPADPTADATGANGTTITARAPKIYNINIPSFEIKNEFTEVTNAKDAVSSITQNIGDEIAKLFAGIGYS